MDEFSDDLEAQAVGRNNLPRRTYSTGSNASANRTTSFIGTSIDYLLNEDTSSSSNASQQQHILSSSRYSSNGGSVRALENSPAEEVMGGGNLINMTDVNLDGSGYRDRTRGGGGMDHSAHSQYSYDNSSSNKSGRRLLCFTLLFAACIGLSVGVVELRDRANDAVVVTTTAVEAVKEAAVGVMTPQEEEEKKPAAPMEETDNLMPIPEDERIDHATIEEIEEGLKEKEAEIRHHQEHALDEENEIPSEDLEDEDILDDELGALAHEMGAVREEEKVWEQVDTSETVNEVELLEQESEVLDKEESNLEGQAHLLDEEANANTAKEKENLASQVEVLQEEEKNLEQRQADIKEQVEALPQRAVEEGTTGGRY